LGGVVDMNGLGSKAGNQPRRVAALSSAALGVLAVTLFLACSAIAQEGQPSSPNDPAQNPPAAPAPPPSFAPGFIDALGRWIGESGATLDSQLKTTQDALGGIGSQATDAMKDAAGAAQQATGAIVGLPLARLINGRQRCPAAANGAPDCGPAADALCQSKGFGSGKGLQIDSAQKCSAAASAAALLAGRSPSTRDCVTETFVTRAVCQ
jgi:hypothetical protein